RNELECNLSGSKLLLEVGGMRPGEGYDRVFDLLIPKHHAQFAIVGAAIVADGGNPPDAFARQRLNEVIRESGAAEAPEHNTSAVRDVRDSGVRTSKDFLAHVWAYPIKRGSHSGDK